MEELFDQVPEEMSGGDVQIVGGSEFLEEGIVDKF